MDRLAATGDEDVLAALGERVAGDLDGDLNKSVGVEQEAGSEQEGGVGRGRRRR